MIFCLALKFYMLWNCLIFHMINNIRVLWSTDYVFYFFSHPNVVTIFTVYFHRWIGARVWSTLSLIFVFNRAFFVCFPGPSPRFLFWGPILEWGWPLRKFLFQSQKLSICIEIGIHCSWTKLPAFGEKHRKFSSNMPKVAIFGSRHKIFIFLMGVAMAPLTHSLVTFLLLLRAMCIMFVRIDCMYLLFYTWFIVS